MLAKDQIRPCVYRVRDGRAVAIHLMLREVLATVGLSRKARSLLCWCLLGQVSDSKNIIIGTLVTSIKCLQSVTLNYVLICTQV